MWAEEAISRKWIGADNLHEEMTFAQEHSLLKRRPFIGFRVTLPKSALVILYKSEQTKNLQEQFSFLFQPLKERNVSFFFSSPPTIIVF